MPTWLITGANRGIGFSMVNYLLENEENYIIATSRSPCEELETLSHNRPKNLRVFPLDITSQKSVDKAIDLVWPLLPFGLDYLINNAAQNPQPQTKFEDVDLDVFAEELNLSTVAPLRVSRAFLPLIQRSKLKKIIFVSSITASSHVTFPMVNQFNTYSIAKAAMNMLARKWGGALKFQGVTTAAIHPGWTQTEHSATLKRWMEKYAPHVPHFTPDEAAARFIRVCEGITMETTGRFWSSDGGVLPW